MITKPGSTKRLLTGFTLVEMAIVLLIVGLLLGGLLPSISSQVEQRRTTETNAQLAQIKEALIGYAIINGRLPCPATSTSSGVESPSGGDNCTYFSNSTNADYDYLPAVTLGLSGTNSSGLLEDAWGNPIRYIVTSWQTGGSYVFSKSNGMSAAGISNLNPTLAVCSTATGITGSAPYCATGTALTSNAVAIVYSTGKNGASGGTGTDEAENLNPNGTDLHGNAFVYHEPAASGAPNGEFDDLMIWISPNELVSRMVSAGQLP